MLRQNHLDCRTYICIIIQWFKLVVLNRGDMSPKKLFLIRVTQCLILAVKGDMNKKRLRITMSTLKKSRRRHNRVAVAIPVRPPVSHQRADLIEPVVAPFAPVRFFARVRPPVHHQRAALAERLVAPVAPVRFFAGVRAPVRVQHALLAERPVAQVAPVRFFAGVRAPVRRQRALLGEPLAAPVAPVRFFAGVRPPVRRQRTRLVERPAARTAPVRGFARVRAPVHRQPAVRAERLVAPVAPVRFFVLRVRGPTVHRRVPLAAERFAALDSRTSLRGHVRPPVRLQMSAAAKIFRAHVAPIR
ncbi:Uncharacterized protein FWK35_00006474 [Aphis craccivora]|uniref:Uncharacterized protein n=1 Tax=Aphis craccivora TaxID=307492 RepID=A0A6G0ZB40_APHCR|nr:Uncharacterized protein FWK35_00006474 [Aphis craccivora]